MNIKKISLICLATSFCFLAAIPLLNTSCSKKTPDEPTFIGNIEGTDWKGYESGSLTLNLGTEPDNDDVYSCSIKDKGDYKAKDWIIPEFVSDGEKLYKIISVEEKVFSNYQNLVGTLTFPNSFVNVGDYAFEYCKKITSVIFGKGLKTIGKNAFFTCNKITSITWGNELQTIGDSSFYMCGLTGKLTIPNSVTTINNSAFNQCTNIASVELGNGLKTIGKYVFYMCTGITSAVTIPDSVVSIASFCFQSCTNIPSISIGSGIQSIGEKVFQGCNALIASSDINNKIFCNADNVYYLNSNNKYYCLGVSGNVITPSGAQPTSDITIINNTKIICERCFKDCSTITNIGILPSSIKYLGTAAFINCTGIIQNDLDLSNIITIGESAFEGDTGFTGNLTISNNLKEVGSKIIWNLNFDSITMQNFTDDFSYDGWKSDSFIHVKDNGTVSVTGDGITTVVALGNLKAKGLPGTWSVPQ